MTETANLVMNIAERFGIPVAFAVITYLLLIWFANQHRSERGEWRDMMAVESELTRRALGDLRKAMSELAVSVAFLDGKSGAKRKPRK